MATYKNLSSDWYITVDGGTGTIYVNGNLDVAGNITYVSDIAVNDAFIIVAANNTGTVSDMGLVATKVANSSYAGLRFDVTANAWQVSSSVYANGAPIAAYTALATGGAIAGSNTQLQFNDSGAFGASANLTFDKTTNQFSVFSGSQVLGNIGSAPSAVSNAVVLYNQAVGVGGSGVYARTSTTQEELVSLTKAKLFAIIF